MFLISYPDSKTGEITTRLCEIQQTRDGDLMVIQHGKIVKDEEPCYRRLKPDKIQGIEALKPIDVRILKYWNVNFCHTMHEEDFEKWYSEIFKKD